MSFESFEDRVRRIQAERAAKQSEQASRKEQEDQAAARAQHERQELNREAYAALIAGGAEVFALCERDYRENRYDMLAEGVEFDRAEGTEYTTVVAYLCKDGIIIEGNCRLAQKWVGRFGKSDGTAFDPTQNKSMPFRYERINGLRIAEVQREPHLGNLPWHSAHDYAEYAAGRVAERTAGKRRDH